jgi:Uma2 family endonuclease
MASAVTIGPAQNGRPLGPADHGRPMSLGDYLTSDYQKGFKYELIDGKLYVSSVPNAPEGLLEEWVGMKLRDYSRKRPKVINWVYWKVRVFVPGRPEETAAEPDVAAYHDFPLKRPKREVRWEAVSPLLVAEVLSRDDPGKDLIRNVALYHRVPSIKEYWVIDRRDDPDCPSMRVHRRHGKSWRIINLAFGETYTTPLLPGFQLVIDPRR